MQFPGKPLVWKKSAPDRHPERDFLPGGRPVQKKGGESPALNSLKKSGYLPSPWVRATGFLTAPERRQRVHTVMLRTSPSGN